MVDHLYKLSRLLVTLDHVLCAIRLFKRTIAQLSSHTSYRWWCRDQVWSNNCRLRYLRVQTHYWKDCFKPHDRKMVALFSCLYLIVTFSAVAHSYLSRCFCKSLGQLFLPCCSAAHHSSWIFHQQQPIFLEGNLLLCHMYMLKDRNWSFLVVFWLSLFDWYKHRCKHSKYLRCRKRRHKESHLIIQDSTSLSCDKIGKLFSANPYTMVAV